MRTILVDDEKPALENLKRKLDSIPDFEVVGMYQDELRALEELPSLRPDIIFVDIEMRFITGLEFLERVFDLNIYPKIVFVTAYSKYAQEAFELNAFDFIRKPVERDRLLKTIDKIDFQKKVLLEEHNKGSREINCLGNFCIMNDGTELNLKWRTRKAEELFLYLLCNYDKAISKEKLVDVLWDKLDKEKGLQYLYNTLYNLKKLECDMFYIESSKGKICLKLDRVQCDIIDFEKAYGKYKGCSDSNAAYTEQMYKLYKGTLLSEYDFSWLREYQSYYDGIWLKLKDKKMKTGRYGVDGGRREKK